MTTTLGHARSRAPEPVTVEACRLDLGELHRLADPGFYHPEFHCLTEDGERFVARMRLHVTEPLDPLIIADPRALADGGFDANSVGSRWLLRRTSYDERPPRIDPIPDDVRLFHIGTRQISDALWRPFSATPARPSDRSIRHLAVTCHDPQQVGGGNTILFRYINWLAELGVQTTVYSCGAPPTWTRVEARFRRFATYEDLFASIEEEALLLYSMWHIEPMLRASPRPRRVAHLRQIAEPFHYGEDWLSMQARKPVIEALERLPLDNIVVSPHLERQYLAGKVAAGHLVTNGIDLSAFYPSRTREEIAPGEPVTILSVGSPRHFVKGAAVLSLALDRLAAQHPDRVFRWIIAGVEPDSNRPWRVPESQNVDVVCRARVTAGDMRKLYGSADVFVNPSLYEGFGLPTLEAMACGVPVVQADNCGLDGCIRDADNCLIVPPHEPELLAGSIQRVLEEVGLADRLVAGGFRLAARHSTAQQFDACAVAFGDLLEGALDESDVTRLRASIETEQLGGPQGEAFGPFGTRQSPLVSVVIPSYNQADYVGAALDSLIAQTYECWEAVVVNDGSTDGTAAVLAEYARQDPRIRIITTPNRGITAALNEGLRHARGDYFCWLSSDDLFYPDKLRLQVDAFDEVGPDYSLVYGSFDFLHEETGQIDSTPMLQPIPPGAEFAEALKFDFIDGCTVMIRMRALRRVGGFNPQYLHSQDMELWMRLAAYGFRFQLIPHKLSIRRIHPRQGATVNMIHCRYDAMAMVDFYVSRFHLLEVYRHLDPEDPSQLEIMLRHLIARTSHTEANVNHPLLRRRFWTWVVAGLSALPSETARQALERCLGLFEEQRAETAVVDEYLDSCLSTLEGPLVAARHEPDLTMGPRDILRVPRGNTPIVKALFEYATTLLIDSSTPLFAQELTFHGVNKLVDTPWKLAHSAIRYLSQFDNPYREVAAAHSDMAMIPTSADAALLLYCRLMWPGADEAFETSLTCESEKAAAQTVAAAEVTISELRGPGLARLRAACLAAPTEPMLHYWNALSLAREGRYRAAVAEAWRTRMPPGSRFDARVGARLSEWARLAHDTTLVDAVGRLTESSETTPEHSADAAQLRTGRNSKLDSAEVRAFADGTYSLSLTACGPAGGRFRSRLRLRYSEDLEDLAITDPTGQSMSVSRADLLDVWTRPLGHRASEPGSGHAVPPSIAFTLLHSSGSGGGPAVVCRYANWLAELGVEVAIYSNDFPPPGCDLRATYHRIPDDHDRYARISESVVVVYSILEWPALAAANSLDGRTVYHLCQGIEDFNYHDGTFDDLVARKPLFEALHDVPLRRIVVSPSLDRYFRGRDPDSPLLVPNGVDLRTFTPAAVRKEPGTTVLVVGAPERPLKGVQDVCEALAIVRAERPAGPLVLWIVGGTGRRPDEAAEIDGVDISYRLVTTAEQMATLYRGADIVVNAAWYEGYGLPTIEAMACGVPVIQADNQGLDAIVTHEHDCLVIPPHDSRSMATALLRLMDDGEERERLARHALKTAARCDVSSQFRTFVQVFEQVLSCRFNANAVARLADPLQSRTLDDRLRQWKCENEPLFSVLVPTFNHAQFLPEALESLRAQTYDNWEAIVVDDGSTDDTPDVLQRYASLDARIRVFRKDNGGVGSALNHALQRASGDWVCWLSADDLFDPEKLRVHVRAIRQHPERLAFYTRFAYLDEQTGGFRDAQLWQPAPEPASQVSRCLYGPYVHGNSVAIRRDVLERVGPFNEAAVWAQDFDMWLRVAANTPWQFLPERTCITRLHEGQSTRLCPEGGGYDSALSCGTFLNTHTFAQLYPFTDLTATDPARRAVRDALTLVANPHAVLHRCGYNPTLLARVIEWFRQSGDAVRDGARAELETFVTRARGRLDEASITLVRGALRGTLNGWQSVPVDLRDLASKHADRLEATGDHVEASRITRYLERRPTEHPRRDIATVAPATAHVAGAAELPDSAVNSSDHDNDIMDQQSETAFCLDHVKTVAIFGAGRYGRLATELAARCGWTVTYFVDNSAHLWNTEIRGIPVKPPSILREEPVDLVVVASHANLDEIARQLEEHDLTYGSDFIPFLAPIQTGSVQLRLTI